MFVCRICLCQVSDQFFSFSYGNPSVREKLVSCIPDMNVEIVSEPQMCQTCYATLDTFYIFRNKLLQTDRQISKYLEDKHKTCMDVSEEIDELHSYLDRSDKKEYCEEIKVEISLGFADINDDELLDDLYTCTKCDRTFDSESKFIKHEKTHVGFECGACSQLFDSKKQLREHLKNHKSAHLCPICGLTLDTLPKYNSHMQKHSDIKPYVCEMCGSGFNQKNSLNLHKRRFHNDAVSIYKCERCDQHFPEKNYMLRHMKIHDGKLFPCKICTKKFNNKGDLGKHMRIHTGEKPYVCKFCGMRFRVSGSLIRHTRSHTGEKPYVCETCGKCFNQKYNLNSHKQVHSGIKPYQCTNCDKGFKHKATLDAHIVKVHAGGQINKCCACFKCFGSEEELAFHKQSHDADDLIEEGRATLQLASRSIEQEMDACSKEIA